METWQATALVSIALVLVIMWGKPLLDRIKGGKLLASKPQEVDEIAEWQRAKEALTRLGLLEDPTAQPVLVKWREKIACGLMCMEKSDES